MAFFYYVLTGILRVLDIVLQPVFKYVARGKKHTASPIRNDILKISATDLASKIRKRELSSQEICAAYIERIKEANPIINAVVENRFSQALREAKNVDDYLEKCSLSEDEIERIKPLLGVPLTVKESCSLQGCSLTGGTLKRRDFKAEQDGEAVSRLRSSGAIPLLVSSTSEICLSWEGVNKITGRTNNPYDTTCTSGASSAGEGALLGAGASVIGIGSDVAGSIRLPCLFNGIFGHKPSPRIVPIKGHYPYCDDHRFADFLSLGPMTRYAKDLKLMLKVMAGGKLSSELRLHDKVDLAKIKIFVVEDIESMITESVQDEIKMAMRQAAEHLRRTYDSKICHHNFENFKDICQICGSTVFSLKDIPYLLKGDDSNLTIEFLKSLSSNSEFTTNLLFSYIVKGILDNVFGDRFRECALMQREIIDKLQDNGVLFFPSWTTSAHKHGQIFFKLPSLAYLVLANALGLPSTSVPCGLDRNGLPIGFQVMAAPNQDRLCLAVAEELENFFGGWREPLVDVKEL